MKKINRILLSAIFLIAVNSAYCGTVAAPYEVGNWPGFRKAAVTYTFDDGCSNQFAVAIPMFNEFDYKLTMFTVTGWGANWTGLRNAAAVGHEVASHTVTHSNLSGMTIANQTTELVNSKNSIESNVPGYLCVTLAYPYCAPSDQTLTAQYYIAARHCQGYIEANTPTNMYQISSVICGSLGAVKTADDFNAKFASVESSKGWCVFLIHGIDSDGGYSPLSSTELRASLQYLDARRTSFWVSTFGNVARYIRERNSVSVTESNSTGNSITLQVTDGLDNAIYNYPVTIRRPLPAGWTFAKVSQNGQTTDVNVVEISSVKYIMFDVVPDGGDVVLSKSTIVPTGVWVSSGYAFADIAWDNIRSISLAGYNIYRSTTSGTDYTQLNEALLTDELYEDINILHDTTYYYVVTAIDTNSDESGFSSEVFSGPYGDYNGSGIVDMDDLSYFVSNFWLIDNWDIIFAVDLEEDSFVNFYEYAILANNWSK